MGYSAARMSQRERTGGRDLVELALLPRRGIGKAGVLQACDLALKNLKKRKKR